MRTRPALAPAVLALLIAALIAGCGGGAKKIGDPRAEVLSYVPADAPVVGLVATDPQGPQIKALERLIGRFPGAGLLLGRLKSSLEDSGANYEQDVKPLLGNDLVFATPTATGVAGGHVMIALVAEDAGRLGDLVDKQVEKGEARRAGERAGAKLYEETSGGGAFAVNGAVVVAADTLDEVEAALDRHERGRGSFTAAKFDEALGPLPKDALLRVVGDARPLLAGASSAQARRVPWVAALGTFAVSVKALSGGIEARFSLDTGGGNLADGDVPIATGPEPPSLAPGAPLTAGVRDLSHVIDFAQRAARAADPEGYRSFQTAKEQIRAGSGVNLDTDVVGQLTGNTDVQSDLKTWVVRVGVKDPEAMTKTLARLVPLVPGFLEGAGLSGGRVRTLGGGLYRLEVDGRAVATYGVRGGSLFVTDRAPSDLDAAASEEPKPARGLEGSVVARVDGAGLAGMVADAFGLPGAITGFLQPIGDITLSMRAEVDRLTGTFRVEIR